jgi:hypothetical protein
MQCESKNVDARGAPQRAQTAQQNRSKNPRGIK